MQIIYLDISNKGVIPTIYAKQGDVGRKFRAVLTDNGLPYVPPNGSSFSVWYSGASGEGNYTGIGDKSAFFVTENTVTVEMIAQMLSNDGNGVLSIVLNDPNGNQLSTWNIPYICEFVPGSGSEEAKNYYTAFANAVANLQYPDVSLSVAGRAADAKATGNKIKSLTASDVGARPNTWTPTAAQVGAAPATADTTYPSCYYRTVDGVKEWVNPPLVLNTEYRTTERYNNKPVYIKRLNYGALPNKNFRSINLGIGKYLPFWLDGYVKTSDGIYSTTFAAADSIGCNFAVDTSDCVLTVSTTYDFTQGNYSAEVVFKYTKG